METSMPVQGDPVPVDTTGETTGDNIVKDEPTTADALLPPQTTTAGSNAYQSITDLKDKGDALIAHIKKHGSSNELSNAVAKIEEGIMWAIKHLGNIL